MNLLHLLTPSLGRTSIPPLWTADEPPTTYEDLLPWWDPCVCQLGRAYRRHDNTVCNMVTMTTWLPTIHYYHWLYEKTVYLIHVLTMCVCVCVCLCVWVKDRERECLCTRTCAYVYYVSCVFGMHKWMFLYVVCRKVNAPMCAWLTTEFVRQRCQATWFTRTVCLNTYMNVRVFTEHVRICLTFILMPYVVITFVISKPWRLDKYPDSSEISCNGPLHFLFIDRFSWNNDIGDVKSVALPLASLVTSIIFFK